VHTATYKRAAPVVDMLLLLLLLMMLLMMWYNMNLYLSA